MTVPAAALISQNRTAIEERIGKTVHEFGRAADAFWRDMIVTSEDVVASDALGREYQIHMLYQHAYAGVIEPSQVRGYKHLYGDDQTAVGNKLARRSLSTEWPDPFEGAEGVPFRLSVPMRGFDMNLGMTLAELRADATPAMIAKVMTPKFKGFANNIVRRMCNYFYADQSENFKICSLGPWASMTVDTGAANTIDFYPTEEVAGRLHVGDMVDIIREATGTGPVTKLIRVNDSQAPANWAVAANVTTAAAAQTRLTRVRLFVSAVDLLENRVQLTAEDLLADGTAEAMGDWAVEGDIGDNAYLVWANSTIVGSVAAEDGDLEAPAGFNGWLKNSGNLLGGEAVSNTWNSNALGGTIDVDAHPEFKTFRKAVNGVLTEHNLGLYLDRFEEAFDDLGYYLDTIATRRGVMRSYQAAKIDREIIDRTGRLPSVTSEGAPDQMTYTHNGRRYTMQFTKWLPKGQLVAHRRQNNWKRYVVPKPKGVGMSMKNVPGFVPIEMAAPALGMPGPLMPYHNSSGRPLGGAEMLCNMHYQNVPTTQIPGLILTGLTEDRVHTD